MAGCDVLYHDPARGGLGNGWWPCPAVGQVWTDPGQVLRFVCPAHRHQLIALYAAGWPTASAGADPGCRSRSSADSGLTAGHCLLTGRQVASQDCY
jgi:hypothetical protein